jgi:hypothetical protein
VCVIKKQNFLLKVTNKKNIGRLLSFRFKYIDEETKYWGYVVDYNDDWTLLKYNITDYVRDGFIILKNKYILEYELSDTEKFKQKILDLKGNQVTGNDKIPLDNISVILNYLSEHYGIFQFNMRTNKSCWLGRVGKIDKQDLEIDYLTTKGLWKGQMTFKLGNIRTIEFDTDYINSLLLVGKAKAKK